MPTHGSLLNSSILVVAVSQTVISVSLALFWDKKKLSNIRIDPVMLKFLATTENTK